MAWIFLIFAGLFEVAGVYMMQRYEQRRTYIELLWLAVAFTISFLLLSFAMKQIPMSTAYAVWTGIGASGGALISMFFFGESKNALRIFAITLILSAAVGLKIVSG